MIETPGEKKSLEAGKPLWLQHLNAKKIYKGYPFPALFLFADSSFKRSDGNMVQLYRMIPLFASERAYELKHGLKKFMHAMDKHEVPRIVDMNRKPFA